MAPNGTLTTTQLRLIEALLIHRSVEEAATSCNVARRTAYNWLKLEHFQKELHAQQKRLYDHSMRRLLAKVDRAVDALGRNMESYQRGGHVQVTAASKVLDVAHQHVIAQEVDERLAAIEQAIGHD